LLDGLKGAKIPSMAAERLLKSLSTHAVCGITGWHQNKAAEVYLDWQHDLWYECLRVNGLDPRKWGRPAPSMLGWYCGLELARQEQGLETGESDSGDSEVYKSEENDEYDSEENDEYDSDDSDEYDSDEYDSDEYDSDEYDSDEYDSDEYDSDEYDSDEYDSEDSDEEGITSLSGGSIADSEASSDFDEQEDISFDFDDGDISSGEPVATPDTTFSGFDEASTDFYPSTSSQHSSTSDGQLDTPELSTDSQKTPSHGSIPESPTSSSQPDTDASSATDPVDEPLAASAGGSAATPNESEVQDEEDGSPSADEFAAHLLAIDDEILQGSTTNGSSASATGIHHPGLPVGFRLYPQAPSPASQLKQLLNLMTQTTRQSSDSSARSVWRWRRWCTTASR